MPRLKCSECGGRVIHQILTKYKSYPEVDLYKCLQCSRNKRVEREVEEEEVVIQMPS